MDDVAKTKGTPATTAATPATPATATTVAASQTDVENEWMDAIKNVFSHFAGGNQQSKLNEQGLKRGKKQVQ